MFLKNCYVLWPNVLLAMFLTHLSANLSNRHQIPSFLQAMKTADQVLSSYLNPSHFNPNLFRTTVKIETSFTPAKSLRKSKRSLPVTKVELHVPSTLLGPVSSKCHNPAPVTNFLCLQSDTIRDNGGKDTLYIYIYISM